MKLIPTTGSFIYGLQNQINHYNKYGYVIIKRNPLISTVSVDNARDEMVTYCHKVQNTYKYKLWYYYYY